MNLLGQFLITSSPQNQLFADDKVLIVNTRVGVENQLERWSRGDVWVDKV
jgi:hypothetical protein